MSNAIVDFVLSNKPKQYLRVGRGNISLMRTHKDATAHHFSDMMSGKETYLGLQVDVVCEDGVYIITVINGVEVSVRME